MFFFIVLALGRTLVDLEDDTLPVRVANVTEGTLKIAAGSWIANCHSVDYVQPQAHTESGHIGSCQLTSGVKRLASAMHRPESMTLLVQSICGLT